MDKIVIFDWGGVIESHRDGEYNIKIAQSDLLKKYGCKLDEKEKVQIESKIHSNMGISSDFTYIQKWFEEIKANLGLTCNLDEFINSYDEDLKKVHYYKDVVAYAHSLKERCKIGIFSNLMMIDERRINAQVDLEKFDFVFLSFKIGHIKPEEIAYEIVEKTTKIKPENILFIDDMKENVEVAKSRGWQTCNAFGYELDKIKEAVEHFLERL